MSIIPKHFSVCCLLFISSCVFSQNVKRFRDSVTAIVDTLYREDQFYASMALDVLRNLPSGFSQNGFSYSFTLGILRDMPINKRRNVAIAPGIGINFSRYNHNLYIYKENGVTVYSQIPETGVEFSNRIDQFLIEAPIEFRWRTSTATSYKFWRIYTGLKFGYMIYSQSTYISNKMNVKVYNNPDLNKFPVGVYLSVGYNSINFHVYYGINSIFKSGNVGTENITINTLNLGTIFYLL